MSKEKQIEEMAKDICVAEQKTNYSCTEKCKKQGICAYCKVIAETLYNAGYRKQSEGEWIDQYKGQHTNPIYVCSICGKGTLLRPHINELDNMEMVQALSPFCPKCGAKMKGGAE